MHDSNIPPGWKDDPSRRGRRAPVLILALAGCGIAVYLTLYQLDILASVFEPFFGSGSRRILKDSGISHLLPIPDASLGALAYLAEAASELLGGAGRWRRSPWKALLTGLLSCGLLLAAVMLVVFQVAVYHAFCTMCLVSALCSVAIFVLALPELVATLQHVRNAK
ncbi:MAG TPA: vitamin K epoxide reductase family protein [Pirellulales bacterium]